jgi:hypothetical protein
MLSTEKLVTAKVAAKVGGAYRVIIELQSGPNFTFFIFPGIVLPFRLASLMHFGSTNPGKTRAYRGRALQRSRWPNFTFFIFPGIVLPFCYFSVVRKVTEKPVLFLPHPVLEKAEEKLPMDVHPSLFLWTR